MFSRDERHIPPPIPLHNPQANSALLSCSQAERGVIVTQTAPWHLPRAGSVLIIMHAVVMRLKTSRPYPAGIEHAGFPPDPARKRGGWRPRISCFIFWSLHFQTQPRVTTHVGFLTVPAQRVTTLPFDKHRGFPPRTI